MSLYINLNLTSTKSGPGRVHRDGTKKAKTVKQRGAPLGFVQHTNPDKKRRRELIAKLGIRQFKRVQRQIPF